MKYSKNIVESNINNAIEYFQSINNNYVSTFDNIRNNLIEKPHHSIPSNYVALFLHHMIKNNVEINIFNSVLEHIYNMEESIEYSLHRFFGGSCCDISLEKYIQLQQPGVPDENKKYSIWNEMSYYFYDIKNNQIGLNKNRIKYLESICELIPEKRLSELYSSGFVMFLTLVLKNPDDLAPVLKKIQANNVFMSAQKNNRNFINSFLTGLSNQSYNMNEDEKVEIFKSLSNSIENFEEIFLSKFLTYFPTDKYKKFNFDLGLSNFLYIVGEDKVFSQINKSYQNILNTEKTVQVNKDSYDIGIGLASEISSSLEVSFRKKTLNIDYATIDIEKSFIDNFVYIKLLEIQIIEGKEPIIDKARRDYIMKELSNDDSDSFAGFYFLKKEEMKKYFDYLSIQEFLPEKQISKTKLKV